MQLEKAEALAVDLTGNIFDGMLGSGQSAMTLPPGIKLCFTLGSKQSKLLVIGDL